MDCQEIFATLLADARIQRALAFLEQDQQVKVEEQKAMALISGAPHTEPDIRSPMYLEKLQRYGLEECFMDAVGNALGYVRGNANRPKVVLEAHLDTVFPLATPLHIVERDGKIHCPGIGDDTAGLACVLSVLRAIRHAGLKPVGRLMLGGVVGEEAPGCSRGVKAIVAEHKDIDAYVAVETRWTRRITLGGIACRRWEVTFSGPGGHSWLEWGLPSAVHAAGRAIAAMAALPLPRAPKTVLNVGLARGGVSFNSIAANALLQAEVRSESAQECDAFSEKIRTLAEQAAAEENAAHPSQGLRAGDRVHVAVRQYSATPGGNQSLDSAIAQAALEATRAVGVEPEIFPPSSTNINFSLAAGIPSVCIGAGGDGGNLHSLDEWYDPTGSYTGAQKALLLVFALAGLDGATPPLAAVRQ